LNLLGSDDLTSEGIKKIFDLADRLKSGKEDLALKDGFTIALLFEEPSTRTLLSLEVAAAQLRGTAIYLDMEHTQTARGETLGDTAKVVSGYCDMAAARMKSHKSLLEFAENSSIPVINALTDLEHPTQALADMYTIKQVKPNLKKLKIAFLGDIATNTANSLMITAAKLGSEIVLIGPKECKPNPMYLNKAKEFSKVQVTDSIENGLDEADIIYTDTYVSMGKEKESEKRRKLFASYQVNSKLLEYADANAMVMHCLPAHRGEEITAEVLDGQRSIVWEQARNKLLLNKAIMLYLSEK
jgi:ornithine carbamoyltransferase